MPDDQGSSTRSEEDSRSGIWAGIRTLLFGGNNEPSLREQIEDVIDEAEEEGQERRGSSIVGDLSPIERKMFATCFIWRTDGRRCCVPRAAHHCHPRKRQLCRGRGAVLPSRATAVCRSIAKIWTKSSA